MNANNDTVNAAYLMGEGQCQLDLVRDGVGHGSSL